MGAAAGRTDEGVIELFDLPHREARALLARGVPVFLGVDPVEYHGPHLSLHNDRLISTGLARDLAAALRVDGAIPGAREWPCVLGANLEIGVEPAQGPGTRGVSYSVLRALIADACRALFDLGARRLVVMTFHGAPLHSIAIHHAVRAFTARGGRALSPMNLLLRALIEEDPSHFAGMLDCVPDLAPAERRELVAGMPLDFHAGLGETSLALHYAPSSVSDTYRSLPDCPAFGCLPALAAASRVARAAGRARLSRELEFAGHGVAWSQLRPFPGYTSRPRLARAQAGAWLANLMTERGVAACRAVFEGSAEAPEPVMPWIERVTLGGRIPGISVPLDAVAEL